MGETTTIRVSYEFKKFLDEFGKKGETYESLLKRLINYDQLKVKDINFRGRR